MQTLLSKEFLDQYKEGKIFSDIVIQFADMRGENLQNISIKNSKLYFVTLRGCNLRNARFTNCEIFFGGFSDADLTNATFENCKIDLTLFDSSIFNKTKIIRSDLRYCGMMNTNIGELDMSTSVQFRVFIDPSQITDKDLEGAASLLMPFANRLDFQIASRIKKQIEWTAERYKFSVPSLSENKTGYSDKPSNYSPPPTVYGTQMNNLLNDIIGAYSQTKKYQTDSRYK